MGAIITTEKINQLQLQGLTKRLISILVENNYAGKAEMVKYYTKNNLPDYIKILQVPERIPELTNKLGMEVIGKIITAELTKFVQSFTVVRPMNEDQIISCAFAIISTSEEDNLGLQDLIIFFEGAKQGKYGRILDHIDQHVIFEMMEIYRQSRHDAVLNIREEQHTKHKSDGVSERSSENNSDEILSMRSAMTEYYKKEWSKK